jgi:hypothetical protein
VARIPSFVKKHSLSIAVALFLVFQLSLYLWAVQPHLPKVATGKFIVAEVSLSVLADTYGFLLIIFTTKKLREIGSSEGHHNDG